MISPLLRFSDITLILKMHGRVLASMGVIHPLMAVVLLQFSWKITSSELYCSLMSGWPARLNPD